MNWDRIAGKWSQMKGEIRQKWGKLTDDDLEIIAGSKDKFVGTIQERYGLAKEEAERQIDEWFKAARPPAARSRRRAPQFGAEQAQPSEGMLRDQH
jgi:uncharacterized protein YjbJ (UPF0337 family)